MVSGNEVYSAIAPRSLFRSLIDVFNFSQITIAEATAVARQAEHVETSDRSGIPFFCSSQKQWDITDSAVPMSRFFYRETGWPQNHKALAEKKSTRAC